MSLNLKTNPDKKSLIQIVALVALLIVGAGAYFMQQDDGLSAITGFFSDKIKPAGKTVTRAPLSVGDRKPGDITVDTLTDKKSAAPAIPAYPAKGEVQGQPFIVEASVIDSGVLTLRSGSEGNPNVDIKVSLFTPPWDVPAGKNFKFTNASGSGIPQIALAWKEAGQDMLAQRKFLDKYTLLLEFGQEKNNKLPGKLYLSLPDDKKSNVAGTFEADIKGFRIVDGKPDLSSDSIGTLEYLALNELLRSDPDKSLEVITFHNRRLTLASAQDKDKNGYLEPEYRIGQGPAAIQRYQFAKDTGVWKIARTLSINQIDEAHPAVIPSANGSPDKFFVFQAAKKLEAIVQKKYPKKGIYGAKFDVNHSDKHNIGVCEVAYRLEMNKDGPSQRAAYLFRRKANAWKLDRELSSKEKVNFDTGRIVKQ